MSRLVCVLVMALMPFALFAEEVVLSDDGREVRLGSDGSWEFISQDRYATTRDGDRVRLKADGSWEPIEDDRNWVAVPATSLSVRRDVATQDGVSVELTTWRIESARDKRKKNTTLRTQMVVELTVSGLTSSAPEPSANDVRVSDSRGRIYPVEQMGRVVPIGSDKRQLTLFIDGAPRWFGIKFFTLDLAPGAFGLNNSLRLTKIMADVVEVEVDVLSTP